eukprot:3296498-Rhodomonas_salina.1
MPRETVQHRLVRELHVHAGQDVGQNALEPRLASRRRQLESPVCRVPRRAEQQPVQRYSAPIQQCFELQERFPDPDSRPRHPSHHYLRAVPCRVVLHPLNEERD